MSAKASNRRSSKQREAYPLIQGIDGRHPLAKIAPAAVVPYPARRRHDAELAFFNFALAREMGLIPASHPDEMTPRLERALLDTFALVIVNEWDVAHGNLPDERDRLPHSYMATRYLQLQHPDNRGENSGDGRSVWNGRISTRRGEWDISSCGTGVTRLCPATSALGKFFKTGNVLADYGCGTAHIEEGIGAALMSEAFATNGISTERVLAVLALPKGQAINVRAAPNLLRPSHFFGLLRRRETDDLRHLVDYYAEREIRAGRWPRLKSDRARYRYLADRVADDFARAAATFESEYIFCWLDWDGDNILTDGSIIDYGSVRQFGLYHHRYRFEDTDRMSTSIPEQRRKARQIVQRFVQIRELLTTGVPPSLASLADDETLERFDRTFEHHRLQLFLTRLGFDARSTKSLLRARPPELDSLFALHRRFEKRRSSRGPHKVPDGLSWNAVHCMRDVVRELPALLLDQVDGDRPETLSPISAEAFYDVALSAYASRADRSITAYRRQLAHDYQRHYLRLVESLARSRGTSTAHFLATIRPDAERRNPYARMTGDGLTHASARLARSRKRLAPEEMFRLIETFAISQKREGRPDAEADEAIRDERPFIRRIHRELLALSRDYRESL